MIREAGEEKWHLIQLLLQIDTVFAPLPSPETSGRTTLMFSSANTEEVPGQRTLVETEGGSTMHGICAFA